MGKRFVVFYEPLPLKIIDAFCGVVEKCLMVVLRIKYSDTNKKHTFYKGKNSNGERRGDNVCHIHTHISSTRKRVISK